MKLPIWSSSRAGAGNTPTDSPTNPCSDPSEKKDGPATRFRRGLSDRHTNRRVSRTEKTALYPDHGSESCGERTENPARTYYYTHLCVRMQPANTATSQNLSSLAKFCYRSIAGVAHPRTKSQSPNITSPKAIAATLNGRSDTANSVGSSYRPCSSSSIARSRAYVAGIIVIQSRLKP